jgi:hypothetical protein
MNYSPPNANPSAKSSADDTLRRRLFVATCIAESIVIPVCAYTALRLAGGDLAIAAPLLAVSALEATRIPLSSFATRLRPLAKLTAILALASIGVLTGELMSTGFAQLLDARLAPVTAASAERDAARERLAAERAALDRLTAEASQARASLADLAAHPPALAEVRSQTCTGRRGSYDCTPASALHANASAQASYDDRLRRAQEAAGQAERRLRATPGLKDAEKALRASEGRLRVATTANPMARLAAGLTDTQLDRVKSIVAVSLGFAIAFSTSLLAFLAHVETGAAARESKLARGLRALIAARRKTIRRVRETVRTEYRDRFIHVPVDRTTGLVLDPDAKL